MKKNKQGQSTKDSLKLDLTKVEIDKKGRVIINDSNVDDKVKALNTKTKDVRTKGPSDSLCIDRKLCLDTMCCPRPDSLCGCMPNTVGCACSPLPHPNKGCIPLGFGKKQDK